MCQTLDAPVTALGFDQLPETYFDDVRTPADAAGDPDAHLYALIAAANEFQDIIRKATDWADDLAGRPYALRIEETYRDFCVDVGEAAILNHQPRTAAGMLAMLEFAFADESWWPDSDSGDVDLQTAWRHLVTFLRELAAKEGS